MNHSVSFKPIWLYRNPHIQTIISNRLLSTPNVTFERERIASDDNDFFDVDWLKQPASNELTPLLILQHGLEGNTGSNYIRRVSQKLFDNGYDIAAVNFRGCSGEHNRQVYSYNAGFYQDLRQLLIRERKSRPEAVIDLVGVSLGAAAFLSMAVNVDTNLFNKMALISVPLDLSLGLKHMERGFSRVYDNYFTKELREKYIDKFKNRSDGPITIEKAKSINSLRAFDNLVTAPLSGYKDGEDYYLQNRPLNRLKELTHLSDRIGIFMSSDDPMVNPEAIQELRELGENHFDIYLSNFGGHVGFVDGIMPKRTRQWVVEEMFAWLTKK